MAAHRLATLHALERPLRLCLVDGCCQSLVRFLLLRFHSRVLFIHQPAEVLTPSLPDILVSHQYISRCALDGSHMSDILSGSVPCCCYPVDVFLSLTRFQVCIQLLYGLSFHSRNHFLCSTFCSFVLVPVIIFSSSFPHL